MKGIQYHGFSRQGSAFPPMSASSLLSTEFPNFAGDEDHKSVTSSCTNHLTVAQTSPTTEFFKFSRLHESGVQTEVGSRISKNLNYSHTVPLAE